MTARRHHTGFVRDFFLCGARTISPNASDMATAQQSPLKDLGLPSWLDSLLQPGVGNGVFITLKASLVLLICVLLVMCCYIDDPVATLAPLKE